MTADFDDFLFACRCGDMEELEQMPQEMVQEQNEDGITGLHYASANGHEAVVKYLLTRGARVNAINQRKNSALHWAALNGHETIVEMLLANGAVADVKNEDGRSASTLAEQQGHHGCVNKLLVAIKEEEASGSDDDDEPTNKSE
jgi:ankyrin repeat protein